MTAQLHVVMLCGMLFTVFYELLCNILTQSPTCVIVLLFSVCCRMACLVLSDLGIFLQCLYFLTTSLFLYGMIYVVQGRIWRWKGMADAANIKRKITLYLQEAVTALQQETIDKDEPISRWILGTWISVHYRLLLDVHSVVW